eukprot:6203032-Pleurochrysis_carterae.AAC.1
MTRLMPRANDERCGWRVRVHTIRWHEPLVQTARMLLATSGASKSRRWSGRQLRRTTTPGFRRCRANTTSSWRKKSELLRALQPSSEVGLHSGRSPCAYVIAEWSVCATLLRDYVRVKRMSLAGGCLCRSDFRFPKRNSKGNGSPRGKTSHRQATPSRNAASVVRGSGAACDIQRLLMPPLWRFEMVKIAPCFAHRACMAIKWHGVFVMI